MQKTLVLLLLLASIAIAQDPPKPVEPPVSAGSSVTVKTSAEFQTAVAAAGPGTVILLDSTKKFGPLQITDGKQGITVRPTGESVVVECGVFNAAVVEKPCLSIGLKCQDIKIEGLTFQSINPGTTYIQYTLVRCGYAADNSREAAIVDDLPNRIEFNKCQFLGTTGGNTRIGLLGNARNLTVRECKIREIHEVGEDSQGILISNSPGPYLIEKCDIEAAGENILLGGSAPKIPNLQLGDLTCIDNLLSKPLTWKTATWQLKNLFELKGCVRGYVARNRLSNNWAAAQDGTAVLFTVRDKSRIADILFEKNLITNVASGLLVSATDNLQPTRDDQITGRIVLRNNTWLVGYHDRAGGRVYNLVSPDGRPMQEFSVYGDRWFHNAAASNSFVLFEGSPKAVKQLRLIDCVGTSGRYGLIGGGTAPGIASLDAYTESAELKNNVLLNGNATTYGRHAEGNFFPGL